jgi:hypothetical protein
MSAAEHDVRMPSPGSIHHFVEIYSPVAVRPALRCVHALEAEVRNSIAPDIDHRIAHARLDWWEQDNLRDASGPADHPLFRMLGTRVEPQLAIATIGEWVRAARIELAGGPADPATEAEHARCSDGASFALIATLLDADAKAARLLGASVAGLHVPPDTAGAAALHATLEALEPGVQRALRPLLVWVALALRRTRRGEHPAADAPLTAPRLLLGDSLHAWRAARAANAGRIRKLI